MPWRAYEKALCHIARAYGFKLDTNGKTGDKIAVEAVVVGDTADDLNLTELAKDLATELER